jgi:hypothetical protein
VANCRVLYIHYQLQKGNINICLHVDNIIFNNMTLRYDSMSLIKFQETTHLKSSMTNKKKFPSYLYNLINIFTSSSCAFVCYLISWTHSMFQ